MKTSTIILIAAAAVAGIYVVSHFASSPSPLLGSRRPPSSPSNSYANAGSFLGGLLGGAFSSHGAGTANNSAPAISAGDKQILDTVTNPNTGAVDLSGVYDNSGIVDTVGDVVPG